MTFNSKRRITNILGYVTKSRNIIGKQVQIGTGAKVKGSILNGAISIGHHCKIYKVNMNGDIQIGNYTSLWGPNLNVSTGINPVKIGNFCSIARNVVIQEYNHDYTRFSTYFMEQNFFKNGKHSEEIVSKGSIEIGHDVWIGANSVILSGAKIGTGAVVAAGSVVNGKIPPYAMVGGTPAKVIKYRFDEKIIKKLLSTEWWNWEEEKLKNNMDRLKDMVKDR